MTLMRNAHFTLSNHQRYTLLTSNHKAQIAYIYNLDDKNALPEKTNLAWLSSNAKIIDASQFQAKRAALSSFASKASLAQRNKIWALIEPLVQNPGTLDRETRWTLLKSHAAATNTTPYSLMRHLRRYWAHGQSRDALLGQYANSGRVDWDKPNYRGRRATKPGRANYRLTQADRAHFDDVINGFYLKDERKTVGDTLQRLLELHYSYVDGNGQRHINPEEERPSYRQLYYHLTTNYSLAHKLKARKGRKAYERNHRPVYGTAMQPCVGVGHIYEIDATIFDVSIVSSFNRADIIGRPTLYYIIDRYSRLIVGWYLGLENPCWQAALHAIFSLAEDKQALCKRLGLEYDPEDWPAHGVVPQEIYADRGESVSQEATLLCSSLETTITNLPSCRPDWKPFVERQFATTHQAIADIVPGYNPASNAQKRRGKDYGLEAALTLVELEAILVQQIITHNQMLMPSYPMTLDQIGDEVTPTPINIWNHDIQTRSGVLSTHSADALRLALLPSQMAIINEQGIAANGCFYMPETVDKTNWFVEGRAKHGAVKISYDRRRADTIYVHDDAQNNGFFVAKLTPRSSQYAGMSISEVAKAQEQEELLKSGAPSNRAELRLRRHEFSEPIVSKALVHTKNAKRGKSKTSRRTNIVQARELERNVERDTVAIAPSATPASLHSVDSYASDSTAGDLAFKKNKATSAYPDTCADELATPLTPPPTEQHRPSTAKEAARRARMRLFQG